jgi:hypothetical protein
LGQPEGGAMAGCNFDWLILVHRMRHPFVRNSVQALCRLVPLSGADAQSIKLICCENDFADDPLRPPIETDIAVELPAEHSLDRHGAKSVLGRRHNCRPAVF